MAEQNRRDEVGRSGIYPATGPYPEGDAEVITPGEINRGSDSGSPVGQSDDLIGAERFPRKGDDIEGPPDSDALGG